VKCPYRYSTYTPDEVAETVEGITPETYRELWSLLSDPSFKKRPLGGDGSNGTIETPDDFSGGIEDAWPKLSDAAKANICECANRPDPYWDAIEKEDAHAG
jgi:hypothetical protein